MQRIMDTEIRRRLSNTFKRIQRKEGFGHGRLKDLDELLRQTQLQEKDARSECRKHLIPLLSIAYAQLAVFSTLSCALLIEDEKPLPADWLGPKIPHRGDIYLRCNLIQITNHGLSILSLIERGFANSARSLLRTLIELTWVTIIFCGNRDKAVQYVQGTDFDLAKEIWKNHFSPRLMMDSLFDIEKNLGLKKEFSKYSKKFRQGIYQFHTQSAHNTSSVIGILSFDSDLAKGEKSKLYPALHGRVGMASKSTLSDTIDVLAYGMYMIFLLFQNFHKYKSNDLQGYWSEGQSFAIGCHELWMEKLKKE